MHLTNVVSRSRFRACAAFSTSEQPAGEPQLRRGKMLVERKDLLRTTQDMYRKELLKVWIAQIMEDGRSYRISPLLGGLH